MWRTASMRQLPLDSEQEHNYNRHSSWPSLPLQAGAEELEAASRNRDVEGRSNSGSTADQRPTVLIVEDERSIAAVIRDVLEQVGYRTLIANNGRVALALLRRERPALVLTDRMMPEVDGIEFVRRLRASPITHAIPVVMMSSIQPGDDSTGNMCSVSGHVERITQHVPPCFQYIAIDGEAVAFLPKPFDLNDLLQLAEALASEQPTREADSPTALIH